MANLIGEYGDIQVLADADAGYFTAAEGVVITMGSIQNPPQCLTYCMVLLAAQDVMEVLIHQQNYHLATFTVYKKRVGRGRILGP